MRRISYRRELRYFIPALAGISYTGLPVYFIEGAMRPTGYRCISSGTTTETKACDMQFIGTHNTLTIHCLSNSFSGHVIHRSVVTVGRLALPQ